MAALKGLARSGIAILLLYGCSTTPPETLPDVTRAAVDAQGVQRATIVADSYWFRPARVVVKAGAPVVLSIEKKQGVVPHSFVIDAPQAGININVALGAEPRTVRFVPKRAGAYSYYCDRGIFETHREKGMVGVLEVTE